MDRQPPPKKAFNIGFFLKKIALACPGNFPPPTVFMCLCVYQVENYVRKKLVFFFINFVYGRQKIIGQKNFFSAQSLHSPPNGFQKGSFSKKGSPNTLQASPPTFFCVSVCRPGRK